MHVFKELILIGHKPDLDTFKEKSPSFAQGDWEYTSNKRMLEDYIAFDYKGTEVDQAEVSFYYGPDTWREGQIEVGNIVPLQKDELCIDEYNAVLDLFYEDIIVPYLEKYPGLKIVGPTSEVFNPLNCITQTALDKLRKFCNLANKSTGSTHPNDEERWFDFICQTVDDEKIFDYDTLYRFLMDEEFWGKKGNDFIGVMGHFAWDEKHASELALEYDNYVRILQFYKDKKWNEDYWKAQE